MTARTTYGVALAALVAAGALWLGAHSERVQWDNDEGIPTQQAWCMLQGCRLYEDAWLDQPPGLPVLLAAGFRLFGRTLTTARAIVLALSLVGLVGVATLGRRLSDGVGGLAGAALLLLAPHFYWLSRSVNPDLPAMGLGVAGLALFWGALERSGGRRRFALLGAGLLFGAAASIKLLVVVLAGPVLVLLVRRAREESPAAAVRDGALVAIAAIAVCGTWFLVAAPEAVLAGVFGAANAARQVYPSRAAEYASWLVSDNLLGENRGLFVLALFGMFTLRRRPWDASAMGAWLAVTAAALILQRPMWPRHHWSLVLWPLAILAGVAVSSTVAMLGRRRAEYSRTERAAAVVVLILWIASLPAQARTLAELTNPPQFAAVAEGAEWVAANVPETGTVISDNGLVSFLGGRPMPPEAIPVSSKRMAIGDLTGEMLVRAAERDDVDAVLMWNNQLEDFPEFASYLPTRYLLERTVGDDRRIWTRLRESALDARSGAHFPGTATLLGAQVDPASTVAGGGVGLGAGGRVSVGPGDPVTITLVWRVEGPAPDDMAAFLHARGFSSSAQADASIGSDSPEHWTANQLLTSRHRLTIPEGAPGEPLVIAAGLYTRGDLARMPGLGPAGERLPADEVELLTLDVASD